MRDLGHALSACFRSIGGNPTDVITLRFSLRRSGELLGAPQVSYRGVSGPPTRQQAFEASALRSLTNCMPMRLSPDLAASIAGRPLTFTLRGRTPGIRIQDT